MQTKRIRLWSKNYTLVSAPSIGRFFYQSRCSFFPFFLFRQLCLYITDSLHLFTLLLTDSLKKCQTKSFENEYSTFCYCTCQLHKLSIFLQSCHYHLFIVKMFLFHFLKSTSSRNADADFLGRYQQYYFQNRALFLHLLMMQQAIF